MKSDQNNLQAKFFIPLLTELQDRKNSMPKIIKKTTVKKVVSKKVSPTTKIKKTEIKKPVIKKVLKKTKVIKSIKTNKVAIDVISDEPDFFDNLEIKDDMPTFSNWPVLKQEKEIEDTETKTDFDNKDDPIPVASIDELLQTINDIKKKKSVDAHGLNSYMFNFLHSSHWSFLLNLYNLSFSSFFLLL
jgi:hypothetical protein